MWQKQYIHVLAKTKRKLRGCALNPQSTKIFNEFAEIKCNLKYRPTESKSNTVWSTTKEKDKKSTTIEY